MLYSSTINQNGTTDAYTPSSDEFLSGGGMSAFVVSADEQSQTNVTPGISVDDVFSCAVIQDALEAEERTQLIQSRTRAQIESLLQFSLGSKVDQFVGVGCTGDSDARWELHNELAILEDAKIVINRQIEEVKRHYARIMQGKLSLPIVDKTNPITTEHDVRGSDACLGGVINCTKERSYSLDDLRSSEF
ncbi:unnamed protein product [Echinostoma caproni]|uniref:Nas2_N domain-containing protein n=1 Tax=Echinostoma caproni TaxID=27848 RepID=A0A183A5X3_9TREM|nr:unnamed protein product [Echinostoma caproni]